MLIVGTRVRGVGVLTTGGVVGRDGIGLLLFLGEDVLGLVLCRVGEVERVFPFKRMFSLGLW